MIYIILLEPQNAGNIGAVARIMKNFGFKNLVLINPKVDISSIETRSRAKHAQDVLRNCKVEKDSFLGTMDILVGTTAKTGTDYNIPRSHITPRQLARKLNLKKRIGILLGREGIGLTNEEIKRCSIIVTIPSSGRYPTLNISQAAAIILYEIFQERAVIKSNSKIKQASKKDKEILADYIDIVLSGMKFTTPTKKETQRMVWKRVLGKAVLSKREAFALIGFFKKAGSGQKDR